MSVALPTLYPVAQPRRGPDDMVAFCRKAGCDVKTLRIVLEPRIPSRISMACPLCREPLAVVRARTVAQQRWQLFADPWREIKIR
jgi:hypothetical protein